MEIGLWGRLGCFGIRTAWLTTPTRGGLIRLRQIATFVGEKCNLPQMDASTRRYASIAGIGVTRDMNRVTFSSTRMSLGRRSRDRYSPSSDEMRLRAT